MKNRTGKFKALKPDDKQPSNQFETYRLDEARQNAKNTAEDLWEILALDRRRKADAVREPLVDDEVQKERNGFVKSFSNNEIYKIRKLACPALVKYWIPFLDAVNAHLKLIDSDQLKVAWDAGLNEYLAGFDPKDKDLVNGGLKFLRLDSEKLLMREINAQKMDNANP